MHFSLPAENVFLDLSPRTKLRLRGTDRVRFLNGQVSNDVRQATAERSVYTAVMTIKGKMCADGFVHVENDTLVLDATPDVRETLYARLERYLVADDVQIEDATEEQGLLHLLLFEGSEHLPRLLTSLAEIDPNVRAVRSTRYGREGSDLFFTPALHREFHHKTAAAGYALLNEDAEESLRILAGVPAWGAELDENTLPAEAGIEDRAVSFTKGCYIGQEIVSRVRSVGHVNRQLRGFRADDASPLYAGMRLVLPEVGQGKEIGRLTSAAPSAGHGGAAFVALGYVRREHAEPGTRLTAFLAADTAEKDDQAVSLPACQVEVCSLPFL